MNSLMADDWDLHAVVRSCTNTAATSTASSSTITNATIAPVENSNIGLGESSLLKSSSFQSGDASSDFPGFLNHMGNSFQGLEEIYKEPYENIQPYVNPYALSQNNSTPSSNSALQAIHNPQYTDQTTQQQQIYGQPQQLIQPPQQQYSHPRRGILGTSLSFSSTSPQPIRPRRRKNQQAKMIHQMTQEELSADSWAWRKYGQKPIKGSPYPRNYYRCSTSKGCTARKQVERCPTDPNMYVVSYSGEHSHPRPTHRSSLAGSTRSKISASAKLTNTTPSTTATNIHNMASSSMASCSSSSPASASSFSPTATPIMEGETAAEENVEEEGGASTENNNNNNNPEILPAGGDEGEDEVEGWEDDDDDDEYDDDILIPNWTLVNDDILKGLQFKD